jgi:hypothetical protein
MQFGGRALAVILLTGVAAAATAQAVSAATFAYETTYSGSYSYGYTTSCPGSIECLAGTGYDFAEGYTWLADKIDTFTTGRGGTYTERLKYTLYATGNVHEVVQNGSIANTTANCTISSTPNVAWVEQHGGSYSALVHASDDPLVFVSWQVPYLASDQVDGFASGPGLTRQCAAGESPPPAPGQPIILYTSKFADAEANHTALGCYGQWLTPTDMFYELWGSDRKVRFSTLPFSTSFGFHNAFSGSDPAGLKASCRGNVLFASRVLSGLVSSLPNGVRVPVTVGNGQTETSMPSSTPSPNKVGGLLLSDGLGLVAGPPSSEIGSGQDTTLLFPGMPGSGSVSLEVTGQVARGSAADAAAANVLFVGHARAAALTPYSVALAPTAAGRALAKPHGSLQLSARISFQPAGTVGHGKHAHKLQPIVASQRFVVGATAPAAP